MGRGPPWRSRIMTVLGRRSKPGKSITRERRHLTVENRALLTWRAGDKYPVVTARIKGMSLLETSLAAEGQPPADQPVWIRLLEPCETIWVEAKVSRIAESGEVGLTFPGSYPYAFYRALVPVCKEAESQQKAA